jgi:23S rRNA (guanine745-N1)-methyltransferase
VLAQTGLLLIVIPAPDHLLNLPPGLKPLSMEANKRQRIVEQLSGLFHLLGEQTLTYEMQLDSNGLRNLIQMTPNYRHLSPEQLAEASTIASLSIQASFTILLFGR